eukprot:TRINITY_DN20828_c0_g1_i1.p2 TRINITY_DN20828_c0_g1~~TRINITY_DN20828_c0_g1_i1.p2  ORF type:complete len:204 (+),score=39.05 TRINITY_DN20828_c0_g1_i1:39-650(+)
MDSNRMRELLTEVANTAPALANKSESNLNLLDLLAAFDQVLAKHEIDPESSQAVELYKAMLRLGRVGSKSWKERVEQGFNQSSDLSSPVHPKKDLNEDLDLRPPLTNLTNKNLCMESAKEGTVGPKPIGRITLPKLQLTQLVQSQVHPCSIKENPQLRTSSLPPKVQRLQRHPAEREGTFNIDNETIAESFHVLVSVNNREEE